MLILKKLIYTTTEIHKHTNIQHVQLVVLLMKSMTLKFSIKESRCRKLVLVQVLGSDDGDVVVRPNVVDGNPSLGHELSDVEVAKSDVLRPRAV